MPGISTLTGAQRRTELKGQEIKNKIMMKRGMLTVKTIDWVEKIERNLVWTKNNLRTVIGALQFHFIPVNS
jgi:uncharacterized membrane-anchored protein